MLLSLTLAAPGLALLGCGEECDPPPATVERTAGLDSGTAYLAALREAAPSEGDSPAARLERELGSYAEWKRVRMPEIAQQPYYRARPEEASWSDDVWIGRDTWWHWTAGNQHFWRDLAQRSLGAGGKLDLLRLVDNRELPRAERFERFGLINDPSSSAPPGDPAGGACVPDEHGLCLDAVADPGVSEETAALLGRPSGVMGLRLFDNPDFRPEAWDPQNPYRPPAGCTPGERSPWAERTPASNAAESRGDCYQPPYLVGIACGFCHISFDPENPPADPAEPGWENLTGALGNVYLKEGPLFAWMLDFGDDAFYTDYLLAQPPGTSDTSRIATDDLDNPGAINALYRVGARLALANAADGAEELPNGHSEPVPRVLKDGADSVGLPMAALRVYVNIGMLGNRWLNDHDAYLLLAGEPRPQRPFAVREAMATPGYDGRMWWDMTQVRMPDVVAYLSAGRSPRLANAPGGAARIADEETLARGRRVFADHCAGCHAGERPAIDRREDPEGWRREMRALVESPGFFDRDFLADDRRHPAPAIGVNLTRSMATNAVAGHVWEEFSSLDYKRLPPVGSSASDGPLELPHPFDPEETVEFCPPSGGRGYYRTASLVGVWATAPFFHNNGVGRHVHDPSVDGRLRAFEDAAEQLLWPERRTGPDGTPGPYVKRTGDHVTWLPLPDGVLVPVPPEYPIKMLGNLPLHDLAEALPSPLRAALTGNLTAGSRERKERIAGAVLESERLRGLLRDLMLRRNAAPDFVENKGHEQIVAGIESDADKRALAELMKTF
jgi:mono/diheme cytochrome c family protein